MIAKGGTHNKGAKLARYITTGKDGERAELWQLCGFAAGDIREAFRSVHVMAAATRCEQPFFHVQVRNPDGEDLTRDEWLRVANRIETKLGLTDQPRAICFHIDEQSGHEHMHLAWSRIDADTMTARPLPFFKERLKEVCRELEKELGLTRVKNERDGTVKAPNRNEFEQARRLGIDIREVRQTIRNCWDHSDNGRSFEAALAEQGLLLAQGDRRAFVVVDHQGGIHALSKRILGVTAAKVRSRLDDLNHAGLPTVEQARQFIHEQQTPRGKLRPQPMPDPHNYELQWLTALEKAAIEKEKVERRFVEPRADKTPKGGREKEQGGAKPPEHLRGFARDIWFAYHESENVHEFAAKLERKAHLASVTKDEAYRSHREAAYAKEIGRFAPVYREGQIVIVTDPGDLYRREGQIVEPRRIYELNRRTTGQDKSAIEQFLAPLDRRKLQGIDTTKERLNARVADRAAYWEAVRLDNAQRKGREAPRMGRGTRSPALLAGTARRTVGKTLVTATDLLESLLAPVLTPEQKRDGERTSAQRAADAERATDLPQTLAARQQERERSEQEGAAKRQREGRERERER